LAAAIGLLAASFPAWTQPEANLDESRETIRLWADDGLELTLNRNDGTAAALTVHGRRIRLEGVPVLRFEDVVEDADARDLLGGGPGAWGMPEAAYEEGANGHPGRWLRVSGGEDARPRRSVRVGQTEPAPLVVSGWCQAQVQGMALGWWNRHLALNANVTYVDGDHMPEVSAYFGQYDHGPQFNRRVISPDRPVARVDLDLSVPAAGGCTAWYRDVQLRPARYQVVSPATPVERIGTCVHQQFAVADVSLRGLVTYQPKPDCIEIRCRLESIDRVDRAVSAYVAVPFDAVGGVWHDHFRASRRIEPGRLYRDAVWYGAGRDGHNSRYPIACVETADGVGLGIGTTVAEPRVFQTEYDAVRRELRIRFDLGLSPDAGRWANRAAFTALLFRYDTRDGFRAAAEKYHRMFGWAFRKRVRQEGLWLAFMSPAAVAGGWQDFHFQFVEAVSNMGWDERHGMYSLRYAEPWIHHHEFPPHVSVPEVHGPVLPAASIEIARRIAGRDDLPLDMRRRYPAYLGSYVEDKWGEPDGYFFRHRDGGRNENMMIVNPNDRLPPPEGAPFCSGGWDREIIRETMGVRKQWSVEGWTAARTDAHPFLAIDREHRVSGEQSLRLDPVQGPSYFEQYLRGVSQVFYLDEATAGPFTLAFSARAEQLPETGTRFRWTLELWRRDGSVASHTSPLTDLSDAWQQCSHTVEAERPPQAVRVSLATSTWDYDPTVLWVDDVGLTADGNGKDLLCNGGFEEAEFLACRVDGAYLDTMECYECNLNYRREHWTYAEAPLIFDSARDPAMHQVFSHVAFARHMAQWLRPSDGIVFGNCAPRTPFAAPYLDVLGNELHWKHGDAWAPWPDAEFNFVRFMCRDKPYCLLQYSDLDLEEQTRYVKRCLFYGVFPSNQAAPGGGWYWADPIVVARHRPVFAKYVPIIVELAHAGWRPLTLATADTEALWIERFGEGDDLYLTVFNPGPESQTATITLDPRLGVDEGASLEELIAGDPVPWRSWHTRPAFAVELAPEDVAAYRMHPRRRPPTR